MTPSVGRIVHYVSYGTPNGEYTSKCRAAIISAVGENADCDRPRTDDQISLVVMNPEGLFFNRCVRFSEDPVGGTWHWPERAD